MKIPHFYIDEINEIIKCIDTLDAGDLFLAYRRLLFIEQMFEGYEVPLKDENYDRLISVRIHAECLLIRKLAEYEVLKMRVECYETKA